MLLLLLNLLLAENYHGLYYMCIFVLLKKGDALQLTDDTIACDLVVAKGNHNIFMSLF